jgi:murein L,D-transpeptidase YcbB/YkuD
MLGIAPAGAADTLRWFSDGRPTATARKAVDLLSSAAEDGLDANDYGAEFLRNAIESAANGPVPGNDSLLRIDQALTSATRRYLADLRSGRIDPQQLAENHGGASGPGFDPDALLNSAIADDRLAEAARGAQPPLAQYRELREALARYRLLAGNPAWHRALPPPAEGKLQPGQAYPGIAVLGQRLKLLGDLPANGAPPARYEASLVDGIKSFQERHGLTPDGVIGKGTFEQLKVTPGSARRPTRTGARTAALDAAAASGRASSWSTFPSSCCTLTR